MEPKCLIWSLSGTKSSEHQAGQRQCRQRDAAQALASPGLPVDLMWDRTQDNRLSLIPHSHIMSLMEYGNVRVGETAKIRHCDIYNKYLLRLSHSGSA